MSCLAKQLLSIYQHLRYTRIIPQWSQSLPRASCLPDLCSNSHCESFHWIWLKISSFLEVIFCVVRFNAIIIQWLWIESLFLEWGAFCSGAYSCLRIYVKEKEEWKEERCGLWRQGFSVQHWLPWKLLFRRLALNSKIHFHLLLECWNQRYVLPLLVETTFYRNRF